MIPHSLPVNLLSLLVWFFLDATKLFSSFYVMTLAHFEFVFCFLLLFFTFSLLNCNVYLHFGRACVGGKIAGGCDRCTFKLAFLLLPFTSAGSGSFSRTKITWLLYLLVLPALEDPPCRPCDFLSWSLFPHSHF